MSDPSGPGVCPRCGGEDVERELVEQTTSKVVAGVVLFCPTCGLQGRALAADREAWFDLHKLWKHDGVPEATLDAFLARWPKQVLRPAYGAAQPLAPAPRRT
jgi:hypothetical protein